MDVDVLVHTEYIEFRYVKVPVPTYLRSVGLPASRTIRDVELSFSIASQTEPS
jgi:hypothetical protein